MQHLRGVRIQQLHRGCNTDRAYLRRVLFEQYVAAFVFRQGEQFRKKTASKQNGTSDKRCRVVIGHGTQTEDLPFCFFLPFCRGCLFVAKALCHGFYRLPAQQGLIPGQKHTAAQFRQLLQQRRKPQSNGIIAAGQAVQQHRDTLRPAQCLYIFRAGHYDAGSDTGCGSGGKSPAEHGLAAKICQQFICAKPAAQPGSHDHTADRKRLLHTKTLLQQHFIIVLYRKLC